MKKILITGATGFIGRNLIDTLEKLNKYEILTTNSKTPEMELVEKIKESDFIVHLAGVTRTTNNEDFYKGNSVLTNTIITTLIKEKKSVPIVFTSSIHATMDNDYGKSKRLSEEYILNYGKEKNIPVYVFRLTNTFGKWARPNNHSVIANFCYNVINNLEIFISDPKKELNLLYIDDVIACIVDIIEGKQNNYTIKNGDFYSINKTYTKTLGQLFDYINFFNKKENLNLSDIKDDFEKKLYETYVSYKNK